MVDKTGSLAAFVQSRPIRIRVSASCVNCCVFVCVCVCNECIEQS